LFQLNIFTVFLDTVFNSVLDIEWIVGVSRVIRSDWHDSCGQQEVVPVEGIVGAVTDHPHRLGDGERVTGDAHRRLFWRLFALGELRGNREL